MPRGKRPTKQPADAAMQPQAMAEPEKPKEPEPPKTPDPDRNGPPEPVATPLPPVVMGEEGEAANQPHVKAVLESRRRKALDADRFDGREEPPLKAAMADRPRREQPQPEDHSQKPQKSWVETRREWNGPGDTGVELVTLTSPDMIGIRFVRGTKRTEEEKREMEAIGLKWFETPASWLKTLPHQPEDRRTTWEQVEALHDKFVEQRRAQAEGMAR